MTDITTPYALEYLRIYFTCIHRLNWLSKEYVMVEELGELAYCIDTSIFRNNECPIVSWDPINEGVGEEKFDDFYKYLYYRLDEMLD